MDSKEYTISILHEIIHRIENADVFTNYEKKIYNDALLLAVDSLNGEDPFGDHEEEMREFIDEVLGDFREDIIDAVRSVGGGKSHARKAN